MRCKSCDKVLNERELKYIDPNDGSFLDLCGQCKAVYTEAMSVDAPYRDFREYVHGESTSNSLFVPLIDD